jgi:hypothetical protein
MWSSSYFAKFVLMERRRPPKIIFQLDVVHNLPTKLPQELLNEKLLLFLVHAYLKSRKNKEYTTSP